MVRFLLLLQRMRWLLLCRCEGYRSSGREAVAVSLRLLDFVPAARVDMATERMR